MLSRDQILAASDIITRKVSVPEWGGDIAVRTLTAAERESWETLAVKSDEKDRRGIFRAALVCFAAVDEKGAAIFRIEDAESLATKSAAAVERLYRVAADLSLVEDKDIEELAKNS